jgi:hypothetical protein
MTLIGTVAYTDRRGRPVVELVADYAVENVSVARVVK